VQSVSTILVLYVTETNMAFDLKKDWSTADVSSLLGSVEDDRSWRLEVTNDGLAQLNDLSTIPDAAYEERLHCFFEIWDQGRISWVRARRVTQAFARRSSVFCGKITLNSQAQKRCRRFRACREKVARLFRL